MTVKYEPFKGHCPDCNRPVEVNVPVPEPEEIVVKEPCDCGLTEAARMVRYACFAAIAGFLALFGGCLTDHYFTTEQVKAMKGVGYEVVPNKGRPGAAAFDPLYKVVPKQELGASEKK